ncbi:MAG: hypothetical protein WBI40_09745 [Methylococcaceae bacterium]
MKLTILLTPDSTKVGNYIAYSPDTANEVKAENIELAIIALKKQVKFSLIKSRSESICTVFSEWFDENEWELEKKMYVINNKKELPRIIVEGLNPAIKIFLSWDLIVVIDKPNLYFDGFTLFEINNANFDYTQEHAEKLTDAEYLIENVFEPFALWINELANDVKWLNIGGADSNEITVLQSKTPELIDGLDYLPVWFDEKSPEPDEIEEEQDWLV